MALTGSEIQRRYREKHGEALNARRRERYAAKAVSKEWRAENAKKQRAQRAANPDATRESRRRYREKYRESLRAKGLEYHREKSRDPAYREMLAEKMRLWRAENPEATRDMKRKWRAENPEAMVEEGRRMRAKHRLNILAKNQNRRALRARAPGTFTAAEFVALCAAHNNRCAYCGCDSKLTVDHAMPLSRGGSNNIENVVPACGSCNSRKGTRTVEEFMAVAA
jgi:5-methylcytosine-specific restriction endonuclease McrA